MESDCFKRWFKVKSNLNWHSKTFCDTCRLVPNNVSLWNGFRPPIWVVGYKQRTQRKLFLVKIACAFVSSHPWENWSKIGLYHCCSLYHYYREVCNSDPSSSWQFSCPFSLILNPKWRMHDNIIAHIEIL